MTRKLASVQRITEINPIDGADSIVVASVLGWRVVVKKGEAEIGDLGVYFEVDSQLPPRPEFEFLKDRKYRIKTIKLRKTVSQGLFMPLTILPSNKVWEEGDDVTEVLGVTKHDPEEQLESTVTARHPIIKFLMKFAWFRKLVLRKKPKGWPSFAKKTDEDRIQLFPHICEQEAGTSFVVSEKLDGCSATYTLERKGRKLIFKTCSRKYVNNDKDSYYGRIEKKHRIKENLTEYFRWNPNINTLVLQGEIVGEGIQKNKYGISGLRFFAFNLILDGEPMPVGAMISILNRWGVDIVPLLEGNWTIPATIDDAVQYANGKSVLANTLREGVVVRSYEKNISFKIISPEFLLKWKV
jgi:hypothetical protein